MLPYSYVKIKIYVFFLFLLYFIWLFLSIYNCFSSKEHKQQTKKKQENK